mmetsp:Transcript_44956/g.148983  ORF Transcript_44956/g.148983 Transcript_44956/m.148983 type:complete len:305 (+) Transcript_44956:182-1096(+)
MATTKTAAGTVAVGARNQPATKTTAIATATTAVTSGREGLPEGAQEMRKPASRRTREGRLTRGGAAEGEGEQGGEGIGIGATRARRKRGPPPSPPSSTPLRKLEVAIASSNFLQPMSDSQSEPSSLTPWNSHWIPHIPSLRLASLPKRARFPARPSSSLSRTASSSTTSCASRLLLSLPPCGGGMSDWPGISTMTSVGEAGVKVPAAAAAHPNRSHPDAAAGTNELGKLGSPTGLPKARGMFAILGELSAAAGISCPTVVAGTTGLARLGLGAPLPLAGAAGAAGGAGAAAVGAAAAGNFSSGM